MSEDQIRFTSVSLDNDDVVSEQFTELSRNRKVAFGLDVRTRILVADEDDEIELSKHKKNVSAVLALAFQSDTFLTCGEDHEMMIWHHHGRRLGHLAGHVDRIIGIWELGKNRIMSLSLDNTIRVWDARTSEQICRIDTSIQSNEDLLVTSSREWLCLMENNSARIVGLDGVELAVLKKQSESIKIIHRLSSCKWITKSQNKLRLWTSDGKILHDFSAQFSLDNGYLELLDGGLLIVNEEHQLLRFDEKGRRTALFSADKDVADMIRRLFAKRAKAKKTMVDRPSFNDFPHFNSHFSSRYIASRELEKLKLSKEKFEDNQFMWEFFNRPYLRAIKTAMKEDIAEARKVEQRINSELDLQAKKLKTASLKRTGLIVVFTIAAVAVLILNGANHGTSDLPRTFIGAGIGILSLIGALLTHKTVRSILAGKAVLAPLLQEIVSFIDEIKKYRRGILAQVPIVKSGNAYSGKAVQAAMDDIVKNTLEEKAMQECGVCRDDVIIQGREAIRLRDWAFIQVKTDAVREKISSHNEGSFWWSRESKQFIFAVQFIQFIFLTKDKIDVFTAYYDFVTDKIVSKEAHTVYYKDVTNISKRDVDRSATLIGDSDGNFEATEIVMAVSSGQEIRLTVLNDDSLSSLKSLATDENAQSIAEIIADLESELEGVRSDQSMSENEKEEEIKSLLGQIASVSAEDFGDEPIKIVGKADEAIENIRHQIRVHKQAATG